MWALRCQSRHPSSLRSRTAKDHPHLVRIRRARINLGAMTGVFMSGAAALALTGSLLVAAPAAHATQPASSTPLGSVTITVAAVHTYEVSGCLEIPYVVDARTVNQDVYWSGTIEARLQGTANVNRDYVYGEGSGSSSEKFTMCPYSDSTGTWLITAEIEMRDYRQDLEYTATPTASFELRKANTRLVISRVKKASFWIEVQGRMTSVSPRLGTVGAPGSIRIEARAGKRWVELGTGSANDRGRFKVNVYAEVRKGTQLRAVHRATEATLGSRSPVFKY
jgi:hypothetical protein